MENQFRKLAKIEGLSLLLILFVTMPLKYFMDMPTPNKMVGMVHGLLFVAYVVFLFVIARKLRWSVQKILIGFLSGVIPFGPFIFEKYLFRGNTSDTV